MKKILIIFICFLPVSSFAQESELNTFFEKYSGKEGYTSVQITEYMFNLFRKIDAGNEEEDNEFKDVVSKLTSIKILTVDSAMDARMDQKFSKELRAALPKKIYKNLMIVKDGNETITFLIKEKGAKISEFVMTVDGPNSSVLIFLEGDISLNQISKLSKSMNINGFKHLDKVKDKQ